MKLRIKSNSVRFRVSEGELEQLQSTGMVRGETVIPAADAAATVFHYEIRKAAKDEGSGLVFDHWGFSGRLSEQDLCTLFDASKEGVYVKQVHESPAGEKLGFVFYVEKDKKHGDRKKRKNKNSDYTEVVR